MSELAEDLLGQAERRRQDLVELVLALASVDAPSGAGAEAMRPAADRLCSLLRPLGGRLTRSPGPQGDLIELAVGPPAADRHVLVLGHYDTVWPRGTAERRPPVTVGSSIRGPGVFDMRSGIACVITALSVLSAEAPPLPTTLLFTPDEETGSASSAARIVELAEQAVWVLVLEPPLPGGALKTSRAGWAVYRLRCHGRAAHAGLDPDRGVSAIDELCDALIAARDQASPARGTRLNAGVIAGGTGANTIAAEAHAMLDVRARAVSEQRRVDGALRELRARRPGASLELQRLHLRPPMERTEAVANAFQHARSLASLQGLALQEGSAGGTSDANLVAHLGVPVLDGLGPEGGGAHAEDEHVQVDSLVQRTALLALLLACPPPGGRPG